MKSKNPVTGLLVALALLIGLYLMLEGVLTKTQIAEAPTLPEPGKSIVEEKLLLPFKDKWGTQGNVQIEKALTDLANSLLPFSRQSFEGYLAVNLNFTHLKLAPMSYVGQTVPMMIRNGGDKITSEVDGFAECRRVTVEGEALELGLLKSYSGNLQNPAYAEVIFLGSKKANEGESQVWLGVALEMYELPKDGNFPRMATDELALGLVVDDMKDRSLQEMTRDVSTRAMSHFFAKIQNGEAEDLPVTQASYTQLMETPDRYRGKKVNFVGSMIFKKRNRLTGTEIPVGLDFYEEAYLLNSDRILYVIRAPKIPEQIKLNDIVEVEGYFLQRYNFLNRMNRATWVPLLMASKISQVKEKQFGLSQSEKEAVGGILLLAVVGFTWLVLRKPQVKRMPRIKKNLKNNNK